MGSIDDLSQRFADVLRDKTRAALEQAVRDAKVDQTYVELNAKLLKEQEKENYASQQAQFKSRENALAALDKSSEEYKVGVSNLEADKAKASQNHFRNIREIEKEREEARKEVTKAEDTEKEYKEDKKHKEMQLLAQGTQIAAETGKNLLKGSFEFIQQIYEKMKQASPLLQAVEQLFSLAMTLFFMPLGNKLGEILIPAVIKLLDGVVEIWEKFGDEDLGTMFSHAVTDLMGKLGGFFKNIASELAKQDGWLGKLGSLLSKVGSFIENHGESLLNLLLNLTTKVLAHLKDVISAIVAFQAAFITLKIAESVSFLGQRPLLAATGAALLAGGVAYASLSATGLATGGHVDPVPGGTITRLAEAGEGEWVIPDSKMGALGGNTYNITFNGYNGDDVERIVQSCVNDSLGRSGFKGGFRWQRTRHWNCGEWAMGQSSRLRPGTYRLLIQRIRISGSQHRHRHSLCHQGSLNRLRSHQPL